MSVMNHDDDDDDDDDENVQKQIMEMR